MKCEIEFLAVGDASSAGDAIIVRYGEENSYELMVVDGGHAQTGVDIVEHLKGHFGDDVALTLSVFGRYAIKRITELMADPAYMRAKLGVDLPEPNAEMRQRFDDIYNEKKAQLTKTRMSRHEFRKWAFSKFKENWDQIFAQMIPHIRSMTSLVDVSMMAKTGHVKTLSRSFEPEERVEHLAKLDWIVREVSNPTFILADCVALAHHDGLGAVPLVYVGKDEFSSAIFPISPTRAICTGPYGSSALIEKLTSNFPLFAAMSSWNFIVAPPSLPIDPAVGHRIGDAVVTMLFTTLEDAVGEMMTGTPVS